MNNKKLVIVVAGILIVAAFAVSSFVWSARIPEPVAMHLSLPKEMDKSFLKSEGTMTVLLLNSDKVFYYFGNNIKGGEQIAFSKLRNVLLEKKKAAAPADFNVIIKPSEHTGYKKVVDALDEMLADEIKTYSMLEITPEEKQYVNSLE
jgi:hypothetical protein